MFNFDVLGSHSSWQCVELLLTHLPLLRLLLSVLLGSYKRVGYSYMYMYTVFILIAYNFSVCGKSRQLLH